MDIHYIYAECPNSENASTSGVNTESFDYKNALDISAEANSPASIQIVLNNGSIDPSKNKTIKLISIILMPLSAEETYAPTDHSNQT